MLRIESQRKLIRTSWICKKLRSTDVKQEKQENVKTELYGLRENTAEGRRILIYQVTDVKINGSPDPSKTQFIFTSSDLFTNITPKAFTELQKEKQVM